MIRLIISSQPLGKDKKPEVVLSARIDKINSNHDEINSNHDEMISDTSDKLKRFRLNILVPRSKYDEIMSSDGSECLIMLNVLTYPEDFVVKKESVKAVGTLTKEQTNVLWSLFSGDTKAKIAEKCFKAPNTINRHSQNVYRALWLRKRCEAIVALIRYILEYWPEEIQTRRAANRML